jgi:hypothetical protein
LEHKGVANEGLMKQSIDHVLRFHASPATRNVGEPDANAGTCAAASNGLLQRVELGGGANVEILGASANGAVTV